MIVAVNHCELPSDIPLLTVHRLSLVLMISLALALRLCSALSSEFWFSISIVGEEVLYLTETNWQPDKLLNVNATTPCARRTHRKEWDSIDFYWDGVELPGTPYSVSGLSRRRRIADCLS